MTATTATHRFEVQEFSPISRQWFNTESTDLCGGGTDLNLVQDVWRSHARGTDRYVRVVDLDALEGQNVVFGTSHADPIKAERLSVRQPRDSWWSVDGRI